MAEPTSSRSLAGMPSEFCTKEPWGGSRGQVPRGFCLREGNPLVTDRDRRQHRRHVDVGGNCGNGSHGHGATGWLRFPWPPGHSVEGESSGSACVAAVAAAATGEPTASVLGFISTVQHPTKSASDVLELLVAAMSIFAPKARAGEAYQWNADFPRPRIAPERAVIIDVPQGLTAACFGARAGRTTISDLMAFAGHNWGGAVIVELECADRLVRFVLLCGVEPSGNAVVFDPASSITDVPSCQMIGTAPKESPWACWLQVRPAELERLRSPCGGAVLVALPAKLRAAARGVAAPSALVGLRRK